MEIELLAPVGSFEAFESALNNGANAVYLAGKKFGAREKATFSNEEIVTMIKKAHISNVKVYVTVNTLIYDDELEEVMKFIDFLYFNDCDAVIVQDLGLITLIRNIYPDFAIHVSTQMNTMTIKQAQMLKNMGVQRIVVARETNLNLIKQIIENVKIEVEVFVHGALCVSYSGQCLFSSSTTKKSGNRGECLQLCRLPYILYENDKRISNKEYLLSMKDLNTIEYLKEIKEVKITSLKIEGRLKSGTYVGLVTRVYRKYLDNLKENVWKDDYKKLEQVFNREFTKGYLFDEKNTDITNTYRPNNKGVKIGRVIDYKNNKVYIKLNDALYQGDGIRIVGKEDVGFYANMIEVNKLLTNKAQTGDVVAIKTKSKVEINDIVYKISDTALAEDVLKNSCKKRFPISIKCVAKTGERIRTEMIDDDGNEVKSISDYVVVEAIKSPTAKEKIISQLSKLAETCYFAKSIEVENDKMVMIPVSILNEQRRICVDKLNALREKKYKRVGKKQLILDSIHVKQEPFSLKIKVSNDEQFLLAKEYANEENIYYNRNNIGIYAYPRISENRVKTGNKNILINELHDIDKDKNVVANYYMNCTNIFSLYTLYKLGVNCVTLSIEMTSIRIYNLINNYKKYFNEKPNIEVLIYGKTDLMITKYCVINKCLKQNYKGCNACIKHNYYLEDRKGYKIPLLKDYYCNLRLINPRTLMLLEYTNEMKENGVNSVRIEFVNESKEECENILGTYFGKKLELDEKQFTFGYFKEKEDE